MTWKVASRWSWRPLSAALMMGAAVPSAAQEPVTAVVHVNVIPMDRDRLLRDQTVIVRGRRIVAMSGLSQRAFAARVGTSASRLSSYVHGHVVPSATMMLRIKRVERHLRLGGEVPRAS